MHRCEAPQRCLRRRLPLWIVSSTRRAQVRSLFPRAQIRRWFLVSHRNPTRERRKRYQNRTRSFAIAAAAMTEPSQAKATSTNTQGTATRRRRTPAEWVTAGQVAQIWITRGGTGSRGTATWLRGGEKGGMARHERFLRILYVF